MYQTKLKFKLNSNLKPHFEQQLNSRLRTDTSIGNAIGDEGELKLAITEQLSSNEGLGEPVQMQRLTRVFAARIDKILKSEAKI